MKRKKIRFQVATPLLRESVLLASGTDENVDVVPSILGDAILLLPHWFRLCPLVDDDDNEGNERVIMMTLMTGFNTG